MSAVAGAQRLPVIRAKVEASMEARSENAEVAALTRAMVRGEEAAWVRFHHDYGGRIHRYALVLLKGDVETADEALQVTFTRMARHIREFNEEAVLWHWIARLTRTVVIDELRKQGRREESLRELARERAIENEPGDWPELVQQALAQMEMPERELLRRKYLEGETVREIARAGEDSEKAVESRMTRARARLRGIVLQLLQREKQD
jgi:RNA polymerase sigma-70 factor (ECF subfamily)